MKTKICTICRRDLPVSEFGKRSACPDGLCPGCKQCYGKSTRTPEARARAAARQRIYHKSEAGIRLLEKYKQSGKLQQIKRRYYYSERGTKRRKEYSQSDAGRAATRRRIRRYEIKNRQKKRAHAALNYAVKAGKLPPAKTHKCTRCTNQASQYHHYLGYEKQHYLDVIALCRRCHLIEHGR